MSIIIISSSMTVAKRKSTRVETHTSHKRSTPKYEYASEGCGDQTFGSGLPRLGCHRIICGIMASFTRAVYPLRFGKMRVLKNIMSCLFIIKFHCTKLMMYFVHECFLVCLFLHIIFSQSPLICVVYVDFLT